ncbi:MAG TPA: nitrile hydratase subunit beta [Solirubrobacteraceae bacterium]|nr:nitrile hydratase subunit beta [Solirubrobacteraceae bacterium]
MNGVHDMGGVHGFGPVTPEPDEPVFHAEWEGRVLAMDLAMRATGEWGVDEARFAREREPPAQYLAESYYERWLGGLERLLLERGLVSEEELTAGRSRMPGQPLAGKLSGAGSRREPKRPARFAAGDRVRARNIHPAGHTRLPRYVRGHVGTVTRLHGCHVFPDASAHGLGDDPQWLYVVLFDAAELWGADAQSGSMVSVDAFEPYLEPAA